MKRLIFAVLLVITFLVFPSASPVSADASESYTIRFPLGGPGYMEGTIRYKAEKGVPYPYPIIPENGAYRLTFLSHLKGICYTGVSYTEAHDIMVKPSDMNVPVEPTVSVGPTGIISWEYTMPVKVTFDGEKCDGTLWWLCGTNPPEHTGVYHTYNSITFTTNDSVEHEFVGFYAAWGKRDNHLYH